MSLLPFELVSQHTEQFDVLSSVFHRDEPPGYHTEPKSKKQSRICNSVCEREGVYVHVCVFGEVREENVSYGST